MNSCARGFRGKAFDIREVTHRCHLENGPETEDDGTSEPGCVEETPGEDQSELCADMEGIFSLNWCLEDDMRRQEAHQSNDRILATNIYTCSLPPSYLLLRTKSGSGIGEARNPSVVSNTTVTLRPWLVKYAAMLESR